MKLIKGLLLVGAVALLLFGLGVVETPIGIADDWCEEGC